MTSFTQVSNTVGEIYLSDEKNPTCLAIIFHLLPLIFSDLFGVYTLHIPQENISVGKMFTILYPDRTDWPPATRYIYLCMYL